MSRLIDSIWDKIGKIADSTLDKPTHISIPTSMIEKLINEFSELQGMIDYDDIYENGINENNSNKKYTILDVCDHFGLDLLIPYKGRNEIKILKEIKTNFT